MNSLGMCEPCLALGKEVNAVVRLDGTGMCGKHLRGDGCTVRDRFLDEERQEAELATGGAFALTTHRLQRRIAKPAPKPVQVPQKKKCSNCPRQINAYNRSGFCLDCRPKPSRAQGKVARVVAVNPRLPKEKRNSNRFSNRKVNKLVIRKPVSGVPGPVKEAIHAVASAFGIEPVDIMRKSNQPAHVIPRQMALLLSRKTTDASFSTLGRIFGLHHTTCIHAIERAAMRRKQDHACDVAFLQAEHELAGIGQEIAA